MHVAALWGGAVSSAASLVWHAIAAINRVVPDKPFQPRWAPAPMLKQKERTFPQLGFPRETDSLCPQCVIEVREEILAGRADWKVLVEGSAGRGPRPDRRAGQPGLHGKDVREARLVLGSDGDGRGLPPAHRAPVPRTRLPDRAGRAPRSRHVVHQVRPRRRADRRPDEPLQHDVRPVLHGRQPGRVRPRAVVRRRAARSSTTRSRSSRGAS